MIDFSSSKLISSNGNQFNQDQASTFKKKRQSDFNGKNGRPNKKFKGNNVNKSFVF